MNKRDIMKPVGRGASAGALGRSRDGGDVWCAVGDRLALRRAELGYSAKRVADSVGITVDDYLVYESGAPIPAFLLGELAELLDRSVAWFFEGVADRGSAGGEEEHDAEAEPGLMGASYQVATIEHRIQALTDSFRKLDFEGQQHLLAISRALSRAGAGTAAE